MTAHKVTFQGSGLQVSVEENETILEAGLRQGFHLPHRCRQGNCGSCAATLVSGNFEQASGLPAQTKIQDAQLLMCSTSPRSDMVLAVEGVLGPGEIRPTEITCRVKSVEHLCSDVLRVQLVPELSESHEPEVHLDDEPSAMPNFLPGQYLKLLINGQERAYSIASAPENDAFIELHIKEIASHPENVAITEFLKNQKMVQAELPFGRAVLQRDSERTALFIAGGTGFAPHKAIIESAMMTGLQQNMILFWGVGEEEQLYCKDLVSRWSRYVPHFHYEPVVFNPDSNWQGKTGAVHEAAMASVDSLADYDVYLSGSLEMVKAVYPILMAAGLPRAQLFSDMADIIDSMA